MSEKYFNIKTIIMIQSYSWYLTLIYFTVVSVMYFLGMEHTDVYARIGVIFILAVTMIKLFVLGEHFRANHLYRYWLLSYVLVIILICTAMIRYFL